MNLLQQFGSLANVESNTTFDYSASENLARELMNKHGLFQYTFQLDKAIRRAGYCNNHTRIISLSEHYVRMNALDVIKDTILHEIAHALTPGHHHDEVWKATCIRIGAKPERCYDDSVVMPDKKYVAICNNCGSQYKRNRISKKHRYACTKCCNTYNNGKYSYKYDITFKG